MNTIGKRLRNGFGSMAASVMRRLGVHPYFLLRQGYLTDIGWTRSVRLGEPVARDGAPIPWMTYAAIDFLESRISKRLEVFEYGSGNSTLWWAERVGSVDACEHDRGWYDRTLARLPENARLTHRPHEPGGAYCREAAAAGRTYDVIVIDGRDRNHCAQACQPALKDDSVIVWDNSERDEYRDGLAFLASEGFRELRFEGLGPVNPYPWRTSILYRRDNCLGI